MATNSGAPTQKSLGAQTARYQAAANVWESLSPVNKIRPRYTAEMIPFEGRLVPKDLLLNSLGFHESTHNWRGANKNSDARGMWQFREATDRWVAEALGLPVYDAAGKRIENLDRSPIEQEAMTLWLLAPRPGRGPHHWEAMPKVRKDIAAWEAAQSGGQPFVPPWSGSGIDFSYRPVPPPYFRNLSE